MKKLFVLSLCVVILSGCATIIGGTKQNIQITAQDPDVTPKVIVESKGGPQEITLPATLKVKRAKQDILLTINDDCYKKNTQGISSNINALIFVNALFLGWGLFSSTTDALTGAAWEYDERIVVYTTPNNTCENK